MTNTNDGPINLARITAEMLLDPLFEPRYMNMLNDLSRSWRRKEICIHEAAHALYFEESGAKDIKFNRPEIFYSDEIKDYVCYGASVNCVLAVPQGLATGDWYFLITKAYLVGGLAAQALEGATSLDNEKDIEDLNKFFDLNKIYDVTLRQLLQDEAIKIIPRELALPENEKLIRDKAVEAKAVLFDPYLALL